MGLEEHPELEFPVSDRPGSCNRAIADRAVVVDDDPDVPIEIISVTPNTLYSRTKELYEGSNAVFKFRDDLSLDSREIRPLLTQELGTALSGADSHAVAFACALRAADMLDDTMIKKGELQGDTQYRKVRVSKERAHIAHLALCLLNNCTAVVQAGDIPYAVVGAQQDKERGLAQWRVAIPQSGIGLLVDSDAEAITIGYPDNRIIVTDADADRLLNMADSIDLIIGSSDDPSRVAQKLIEMLTA